MIVLLVLLRAMKNTPVSLSITRMIDVIVEYMILRYVCQSRVNVNVS